MKRETERCLAIQLHRSLARLPATKPTINYPGEQKEPCCWCIKSESCDIEESECLIQLRNGGRAHYVIESKFNGSHFWLATKQYPQNDWLGGNLLCTCTMTYAHGPHRERTRLATAATSCIDASRQNQTEDSSIYHLVHHQDGYSFFVQGSTCTKHIWATFRVSTFEPFSILGQYKQQLLFTGLINFWQRLTYSSCICGMRLRNQSYFFMQKFKVKLQPPPQMTYIKLPLFQSRTKSQGDKRS